jgi:hemoglobin
VSEPEQAVTVFDVVGGQPFFDALCDRFYRRVDADPVLRPLYPDEPAAYVASERWLALFLGQYWGGPGTYSEARGHPRLRMRHAHFLVGQRERDAWYDAMAAAVDEACVALPVAGDLRAYVHRRLLDYFAMAADHLRNSAG